MNKKNKNSGNTSSILLRHALLFITDFRHPHYPSATGRARSTLWIYFLSPLFPLSTSPLASFSSLRPSTPPLSLTRFTPPLPSLPYPFPLFVPFPLPSLLPHFPTLPPSLPFCLFPHFPPPILSIPSSPLFPSLPFWLFLPLPPPLLLVLSSSLSSFPFCLTPPPLLLALPLFYFPPSSLLSLLPPCRKAPH